MYQMRLGGVRIAGRLFVLVGLVVLLLPISAPALAGSVLLGFCETYSSPGGATCTHRGVDVEMNAGSLVEAPLAGEVRFAGRVPGPHGGSVIALTLETPEGTVTMMPLSSLDVVAGDRVASGEVVGKLAAGGDPSTAASHLHLGLKRSGVYVDPAPLIRVAPSSAEAGEPPAEAVPAPESAPALGTPSVVAAPTTSPSVAEPLARGASGASVVPGVPTQARAGAGHPAEGWAGRATQGEGVASGVAVASDSLPAGVSIASAETRVVRSPMSARTSRSARSGSMPAGLARLKSSADLGAGLIALGVSALSALTFLIPLFLVRRSIALRVIRPPVSDRLGTLLQHLKAGDTLCGLTSCSGPTAFTVPGPLAQRR